MAAVELILMQRVDKLGQMGDVVRVKPGYARNYLLPQKMAMRANKSNREQFETQRAQLEAQNLRRRAEAERLAERIGALSVVIIRQASDAGSLYGSVSGRDIADGCIAGGLTVNRSQIILDHPIKVLGLSTVRVVLHPEVSLPVTVNVARSVEEAEKQARGERIGQDQDDEDAAAEPGDCRAVRAGRRAGHPAELSRRALTIPGVRPAHRAGRSRSLTEVGCEQFWMRSSARFVIAVGRLSVRYPDGKLVTYAGGSRAGGRAWRSAAPRTIGASTRDRSGPCRRRVPIWMAPWPRSAAPSTDVLDVLVHNHEIRRPPSRRRGCRPPCAACSGAGRSTIRRRRSRRNVGTSLRPGRPALRACSWTEDWQYSCAYFADRHASRWTTRRQAKKRHIAAKLLLDAAGADACSTSAAAGAAWRWGWRATTAPTSRGSPSAPSNWPAPAARAQAEAGLADKVRFELLDYRDPALARPVSTAIVSVGMFEHVGINHYGSFFTRLRQVLAPGGVALVHAIGRSEGPAATNPWLRKYIFPGGYSPALSEVFPAVEQSGLIATDLEVLRLHYADTLRHWRRRFAAHRAEAAALYDERFCRMFEFYLAGSELAFRRLGHMVWQMQLSDSVQAVPLTRGYMTDEITAVREAADWSEDPGCGRESCRLDPLAHRDRQLAAELDHPAHQRVGRRQLRLVGQPDVAVLQLLLAELLDRGAQPGLVVLEARRLLGVVLVDRSSTTATVQAIAPRSPIRALAAPSA